MKFSTISANPISILLVSIASMATASGQAPTWNPHTNRQVEKYDNPPALIYRLDTSPRMVSPHGVFVSYQVNVDANGNNIVGDAANECTISVDPTNLTKMAIGWRQFDNVYIQLPSRWLGLYYRCGRPLDLPRCSGTRSFPQRSGDELQ